MYINFMDILRDIQNGIYPQVKQWRDEAEIIRSDIEVLKLENEQISQDTYNDFRRAQASESNAEYWANSDVNVPVKECSYDETNQSTGCSRVYPEVFSAKHWANQSEFLAQVERWKAEAAEMTACSFSNQAPDELVKIYSSNGDGTFTERELEYVFSALHYRQDAESLTGHKRWIESQVSSEGQTTFGFQKNINHADVYVNGVRQIEGSCYTRILKDLDFATGLRDGDTVTVSGMEATTGSEFQTLAEETKQTKYETEQLMWETEASELTAQSFVSEPVDQFVSIYSSNGDGTFSSTITPYYSALHWSVRMNITMSHLVVVDTYHDLTLVNVNEAKTVYVRGGFLINDGRQGLFVYDATLSGTNNNGTIINGWVREYNGNMNIKWFPVMGDAIVDDTEEINKALDWDDEIYFPSGTYNISDTINIRGKRIVSHGAIIQPLQSTGVAIKFSDMRVNDGIFGHMIVKWVDNDMNVEKISYRIDDSIGAEYSISSVGASRGIDLAPVLNSINNNTFKIKGNIDNTVGVYVGKMNNTFRVRENLFYGGKYSQNRTIQITDKDSAIASFVYVEDTTAIDNAFLHQNFRVIGNPAGRFLLFRIFGKTTTMQTTYYSLNNNTGIYAEMGGKFNLLDISKTVELKAYINEDVPNGYVSNIDTSSSQDLTVVGRSEFTKSGNKTVEVQTNGAKAAYTIVNNGGLAVYLPTADNNKVALSVKNEASDVETQVTAKGTTRIDSVSSVSSDISNEKLEFLSGSYVGLFDASVSRLENGTMVSSQSAMELSMTNTATQKTNSQLADSISMIDGSNTDKSIIKSDSITVNDGTLFADIKKDMIEVKDTSGGGKSTKITDDEIVFTVGGISSTISGDSISLNDGTNSNVSTPTSDTLTAGGDVNTQTASSDTIVDGTGNVNTSDALRSEVTDGTFSTIVSKGGVTIDSDKGSSPSDTNIMNGTSSEISDGTETSTVTKTGIRVDDTAGNVSEITNAGASQLVRDDASAEVIEIKNSGVGGVGAKIDVADANDTAIEILAAGSAATKITAGQNWTVAGKQIVWSSATAPTTGTWAIGDIAYNAAPTAGGTLGWVCTTAGVDAAAVWKTFGQIEV